MQRVRVGLTGLACVFLLVLLAAAFFGLARREPGVDQPQTKTVATSDGNVVVEETPKEPLAELGVTPGNVPDEPALSPLPGVATQTR